jgi:hypothetical protein
MKSLGDKVYKLAYLFFEKLRILEEKDKSDRRLEKTENPTGCHYNNMLSLDRGFSFRYFPTILIISGWCVNVISRFFCFSSLI